MSATVDIDVDILVWIAGSKKPTKELLCIRCDPDSVDQSYTPGDALKEHQYFSLYTPQTGWCTASKNRERALSLENRVASTMQNLPWTPADLDQ